MLQAFFEHPELQKFMLVFIRTSAILVFAPPFFNRRLSLQLKGGLAFFLTLAIYPTVRGSSVVLPATPPDLALAVFYELLIGFVIGFAIQLLFNAFELAGELIDTQIGFAMANLVDPDTDHTVSLLASLLMNLGLFMFLELDGHMWLLETYAGSFLSLPIMEMKIQVDGLVWTMSKLFITSIVFAVQLALPVIIIMQLIYLAQGFVQRTIPQLQIFSIGFIFTIVAGLVSVRLILQQMPYISQGWIEWFEEEVWFLVSNLGGA